MIDALKFGATIAQTEAILSDLAKHSRVAADYWQSKGAGLLAAGLRQKAARFDAARQQLRAESA